MTAAGGPTDDPIGRAIARSRGEQESVRGWVQPEAPRAGAPLSALGSTERRQFTVDFDLLHRNRLLCGGANEDALVADKYRLLRTRVLHAMRGPGWKSLGVTSPGPKAGKSVTAINLAISIAREANYRVVLVDGDIRRPSIAAYLGLDAERGLPEYLSGQAALDDVLIDVVNIPTLTVLPGAREGMTDAAAPELLKSERMQDLLHGLPSAHRSTVVLMDLPPALVGDDVIAVAANLDALLLVVDEVATTLDELKEATEHLSNFNLLGAVLNKSAERHKSFEGYYHAGYSYATSQHTDDAAPTGDAAQRQ